jgi:RHS repeat-associated protein
LSIQNQFGYIAAEWAVPEGNGILEMGARSYSVETGRFQSRHPAQDEVTFTEHSYVYAANNPITFSDPSGLHCPGGLCHQDPQMDSEGRRHSHPCYNCTSEAPSTTATEALNPAAKKASEEIRKATVAEQKRKGVWEFLTECAQHLFYHALLKPFL